MSKDEEVISAVWDLNVSMPEGMDDFIAFTLSGNGDIMCVDFLGYQIYNSDDHKFNEYDDFTEVRAFLSQGADEVLKWLPEYIAP